MPEQFKKQEGVVENGESQEQMETPEQKIERERTENQEQFEDDTEELEQKKEQAAEQVNPAVESLSKVDKVKLEKIKTLSPKEQIKRLIEFALDKEEKGGAQRAIEIAAGLDNPNVLDGVRDGLAKKMDELVAEKKIKEI